MDTTLTGLIRTLLLSGSAVGGWLLVVFFSFRPWYATVIGRTLYFEALATSFLLTFLAASRWFDFANYDWLFIAVYFFFGLARWIILFTFVRTQIEGDRFKGTDEP